MFAGYTIENFCALHAFVVLTDLHPFFNSGVPGSIVRSVESADRVRVKSRLSLQFR